MLCFLWTLYKKPTVQNIEKVKLHLQVYKAAEVGL